MRRIHGVNGAPVDRNWYNDQRSWFRHWEIPSVRIHDCAHRIFDSVDLHHLFPNPDADPEDPASYRFTLTDDLLKAIRDTGADIYFRLGESIEHQPTMMWACRERWTPERMAAVCRNIVRHYNHGWADGYEWGIHYWEFWNEPNGPRSWSGTPEQFFALYRAVTEGDWRVTRLRVLDRINDWREHPAPAIIDGLLRIPIVGAGIIALELQPGVSASRSQDSTRLRNTVDGDW